ncbi:hypothetical protein G6F56_005681 [Rhizopus delemar]|nr:hypothetical protein G6F56_005681 [Rhizopus delemar]
MNLAYDITSLCRIRVLLVPISPIKQSVFNKYAQLIKSFYTIRLGDVTPNLNSNDIFNSQVFPEGQLCFDFFTNFTNDHVELQDFEPYRRIFGVIGILDCQEWKDKSFNESYEETMKEEYPTAVVTRCFAFDPTENQADNANGLIMIPNIGNMAFYMSTMMNDFANEMLAQFSILASRIQSLEILESPISTTQTFSRVRQRSSSANAEDLKKKTPGRIKKLLGDFYLLAGRLPDAIRQYVDELLYAILTILQLVQ